MITFDALSDGISSVTLVNHMGDDLMVVNAARASLDRYHAMFHEEPPEDDIGLLRYLARHKHWTPFAHPQLQFSYKMPLFVARQWFKSSVGFNRSEVSRRYVSGPPEFHIPHTWRQRAANIKQGSGARHPDSQQITEKVEYGYQLMAGLYDRLLEWNVAPEQAREVLPVATYTEFLETGSLAAYSRLVNLRRGEGAQLEAQSFALVVSNMILPLFPHAWSAL